ncbi:MAG: potassium transporter TrkG [Erysipelotrichaceae bacterium]|nr:potassium transporter TrkG [Erysipelotrichaceae bacterium]
MISKLVNKIKAFINEHLKTGTVLVLSFLIVILCGTVLLCLPISQRNSITILDAAFTSVSATCVTGLMTINNFADLTLFGQIVVLLMIQIGGLGLMSFISLMLMAINNKLDYKDRSLIKDMLNKDSFEDIGLFLTSIVNYSLMIEATGFLILLTQMFNGTAYSVFQSLFLSISAFCNAGMDIIGYSSLMPYQSNFIVNFTVITLIVLGGLGFAVWFDVTRNLKICAKMKYHFSFFIKSLKLQTKIVLIMSNLLIISGALLTLLFEYDNALAGLNLFDKIIASLFNSVTLRTAGFYTIDNSILNSPSKIFMSVYMLIGGSPGGTAGGLKTTTIFLVLYAIYSELKGRINMHLFNRHITKRNFIRASMIMMIYILLIIISLLFLTSFEKFSSIDLLFEACSALGTVGLTIGITPELTALGKIIIMLLMYIGRVGPVTLLFLLKTNESENQNIKYPITEIMVG